MHLATPDISKLSIKRGANQAKRPSRRNIYIIVAIGLIAAALGLRATLFAPPIVVEIATVTTAYPSQQYTLLNATGYVVAQRKAAVSSKATGRLEWLGVTEGSVVKKGDVIARLENGDLKATLQQSSANVSGALAKMEEARAQQTAADAKLAEAQAEMIDAEAALKRANDLQAKGFVSASSTDTALARRDKASAALASAKASLNSSKAGISTAQASIAAANAGKLSSAVSLEYTLIRAPFDGVVVSKNANVGDIVTPFSSSVDAKGAVVNLADMSTLEIEADVSESSLYKIKPQQPCEIQLDALPDTRLRGEVSRIVPTVDRAKATILVKVRFLQPDSRVLPDMSAKVAFLSQAMPENRQKPVLAVRGDAVVDGAVYVVENNLAKRITVQLGEKLGELVEVKSGVKAGDRIVIKPDAKLKDGAEVKLVTP
jgi:RND family efflux transporter MFP subunit